MEKASMGRKIGAFVIGWIGGGATWALFQGLGLTDSDLHPIGTLVAIIAFVFVWAKLYQHYSRSKAVKK